MEQQALDTALSFSSLPVKAEFVVTSATSVQIEASFHFHSSVPVRCNSVDAREQQCRKCGEMGHFARICKYLESQKRPLQLRTLLTQLQL